MYKHPLPHSPGPPTSLDSSEYANIQCQHAHNELNFISKEGNWWEQSRDTWVQCHQNNTTMADSEIKKGQSQRFHQLSSPMNEPRSQEAIRTKKPKTQITEKPRSQEATSYCLTIYATIIRKKSNVTMWCHNPYCNSPIRMYRYTTTHSLW